MNTRLFKPLFAAGVVLAISACAGEVVDGTAANPTPTPAPGGGEELPLLGSKRAGHYWFDYCEGKADDTPVPQDPRELVVPGVNDGKAVLFNAYWQTCQDDNHPGTCGELRARSERGYRLIAANGEIGAGTMFGGDASDPSFGFPADTYNTLWQRVWRMDSRPENFDQLVAERWGMPMPKVANPYPLPGEDPNATDGGSGQLPMGLTQLRNDDGSWTGNIGVTCNICHGGAVGSVEDGDELGPMYGTNSLSDITVMFTELGMLVPQQSVLAVISQNKVRGTGNITNFQLFGTLTLFDALIPYLTVQTQPSTGTEDPPVWWNVGSRPMKFFDGGMPTDAKRIELSFHFPNVASPNNVEGKQWIIDHQQAGDSWLMSMKSPAWPEAALGAIDTQLAEAGAVLFHAKDLWAPALNNPVARPQGGNGSCASCHGAYSPRYVNDPAYLDTPLLEGIAAYITPIDIIATDTKRLDGHSQIVSNYARDNWFAYNDGPTNDAGIPVCGSQNDSAVRGDRELGYLAPPLYGVWATAPYFHNGAVPNLWEVLKPEDRKTIWRRLSMQGDIGGVRGFDYSLDTGYDAEHVGWNYEELSCGTGSLPLLDCNPTGGVTLQPLLGLVWANGGLAWNLLNLPILTEQQIEDRKVYNTNYYSQDNAGHEFTSVLTDAERRAIIEYLKTL
jgi:mono/diheme cytochrome c family protein